MKITADEEYSLRILLRIAKISAQEAMEILSSRPVRINEIASAEGISHDYAVIFLTKLKKAGLIESIRGKNGGYKLSKPPSQITLYDVLHGVGDTLFDSEYCNSHSGVMENCAHSCNCSIRSVWSSLTQLMDHVLKQISLADLMQSESSMGEFISHKFIQPLNLEPITINQLGLREGVII